MIRFSAALLLVGGPIVGLLFGSLEMAALAFGFGAVHLGLGQLWASEDRGGRVIGVGKGPATVRREEFLGALSGERGHRAKEPANEFAPRTSVGKARDF